MYNSNFSIQVHPDKNFVLCSVLYSIYFSLVGFHGLVMPRERDMELTLDSPLEFFLPSLTGPGVLILMLSAYLIETNNNILDKYAGVRDIKYVCFGFHNVLFL